MTAKVATLPPEDDSGEATVKTIDRAARLLRAVSTHGDGAMLSAVARETGLGKGTVHRLLNALVDAGFVFQEPETKRYRLGAGLGLLGQTAHRHDLASLARPSLLRLAEETADTIFASLREGGTAVCVGREIGAFPIRTLSLDPGHIRPLGVGSGSLALLAFLPDEEIATIIERNIAWLAKWPSYTRKALLADVAETRRRGYSFVDGRIVPGMNAIGVPVLDARGRAVAALSLAAIADRVSGPRVKELVASLNREAAELARAMDLPAQPQQRPQTRRAHGA
jgi:DNA-binding IclR family transcriptional regulator